MSLLTARSVSKNYGAVAALDQADLVLEAGEVHVLIGTNGSGKSTLCKIIAGAVAPDQGVMELDGEAVRFERPAAANAAGISVFYQELSLIPQLSVAQNVFLGREPRTRGGRVDESRMRRAAEVIAEPFLAVAGSDFAMDARMSDLAPDQWQLVEIMKVLSQDTRILLFDEATATLDHRQVEVFFEILRTQRERRRGILFISHRMDEIFEIGDRITVLRDGRTVSTLDVATTDRDSVVAHMVGDAPSLTASSSARKKPGASLLKVDNWTSRRLQPLSFTVHAGEIVGLGGLHGQGQSTLLRSLFGVESGSGGVSVDGASMRIKSPRHALKSGIAYVSGDRVRDGILPTRSVFENLIPALLSRQRKPWIRSRVLREMLNQVVARMSLRFSGYDAPVTALSGGNQQKVVIARWLAAMPQLMLLDDPAKGIDVQARADLYALLRELTHEGLGILLYSSDDAELLELSDRILVFNAGQVTAELEGEGLNRFELYRAAYGQAA